MQDVLRWFILLCGIVFSYIIIRLLLKHKINARNSVAWLLSVVAVLLLAAFPGGLDRLANVVGVQYPPTLMFLFSTLVLLLIVLYQSMQISTVNEKIRQLSQHVALHDLDNDLLAREVRGAGASAVGKPPQKSVNPPTPAPSQEWLQ
ncbi:hypothetical protein FHS18_000771 [Paenibacillus phyllosphaerae]|uniref:DUF2304 domain-containing protein n=1 Tax=Paenibacillus phyllosphaerae TaxID=274593 RepID=A0A7W5AU75_9BACL|nr:DUF2304 domain-containing protein [Paenibacillus phyllosphaerae]MBB3108743.1 hypothetical protein [Paenibacillus phyllosphaerae]